MQETHGYVNIRKKPVRVLLGWVVCVLPFILFLSCSPFYHYKNKFLVVTVFFFEDLIFFIHPSTSLVTVQELNTKGTKKSTQMVSFTVFRNFWKIINFLSKKQHTTKSISYLCLFFLGI